MNMQVYYHLNRSPPELDFDAKVTVLHPLGEVVWRDVRGEADAGFFFSGNSLHRLKDCGMAEPGDRLR